MHEFVSNEVGLRAIMKRCCFCEVYNVASQLAGSSGPLQYTLRAFNEAKLVFRLFYAFKAGFILGTPNCTNESTQIRA